MCEYTVKDYKKGNPAGVRDAVTTFSWRHCIRLWPKSAFRLTELP